MTIADAPRCFYCSDPLGGGRAGWFSYTTGLEVCPQSPTHFHEHLPEGEPGPQDESPPKEFSAWQADVIIANLTGPWHSWLSEFELAAGRGDHERADFCLDRLQFFDRLIYKVRSLAFPEEVEID